MRRAISLVVVVAATLALPATSFAQAQPEPAPSAPAPAPMDARQEEARTRFKLALDLADDGQFDAALVELRRAYELSPSYRILYNIGVVQQQLKDYARALDAFERYLSEGGAEVPADRLADVKVRMDRLRGRVSSVDVRSTEAGAEVSIDDRLVGRTPLPPLRVNSGQRKVTIAVTGRAPQSRMVELAGGETKEVTFDLTIATITAPPPQVQEKINIVPLVAWGATLILAGGALGTGVVALGKSNDYDDKVKKYGVTSEELRSSKSDVTKFAVLTDVFLGAAIVAAGVSAYLTISSSKKKSAQTSIRLAVGAGTAALVGSF